MTRSPRTSSVVHGCPRGRRALRDGVWADHFAMRKKGEGDLDRSGDGAGQLEVRWPGEETADARIIRARVRFEYRPFDGSPPTLVEDEALQRLSASTDVERLIARRGHFESPACSARSTRASRSTDERPEPRSGGQEALQREDRDRRNSGHGTSRPPSPGRCSGSSARPRMRGAGVQHVRGQRFAHERRRGAQQDRDLHRGWRGARDGVHIDLAGSSTPTATAIADATRLERRRALGCLYDVPTLPNGETLDAALSPL